jgi:hypothetical protein
MQPLQRASQELLQAFLQWRALIPLLLQLPLALPVVFQRLL